MTSRQIAWVLLLLAGCINQVARAVAPEPAGGGTLTCREIIETCDRECTQPLCLHGCSSNGTAEGRDQHDALLACGERSGCSDEACMRTSCPTEVQACEGAPAAAAPEPTPLPAQ